MSKCAIYFIHNFSVVSFKTRLHKCSCCALSVRNECSLFCHTFTSHSNTPVLFTSIPITPSTKNTAEQKQMHKIPPTSTTIVKKLKKVPKSPPKMSENARQFAIYSITRTSYERSRTENDNNPLCCNVCPNSSSSSGYKGTSCAKCGPSQHKHW